MDFWRVIAILDKRKWLICVTVIVTGLGAFAATRLLGAKWTATIRFVTPTGSAAGGASTESQAAEPSGASAMVVAKQQASIYQSLATSKPVLMPALTEAGISRLTGTADDLVVFEAVSPRLFEMQVSESTPTRTMALANALAEIFIQQNRTLYGKEAKNRVELLQDQLRQVDTKLVETRRKNETYRRKHNIVATVNDQLGPTLARLQAVRLKFDDASQRLVVARARLSARKAELATLPATVAVQRQASASPLVKQLEGALAQVEGDLTTLRVRYTDEKSEVRQALATRDALQARLIAEMKKLPQVTRAPNPDAAPLRHAIREAQQEIRQCEAETSALRNSLSQAQAEVTQFSGVDGPLAQWYADVNQLTESRANLAARLQTARMAEDAAINQDRIAMLDPVSDFNPPINATAGRTVKLMLVGILGALIGSCGLALLLDCADRRVKTVGDAERALPVPVLAAIPQPLGAVVASSLCRAAELFPQSIHSEAFHFLGMHLLRHGKRGIRSLMVLSAKADQGTTSTVTNVAITLAQAGHRVIIVDANLRTPTLHQIFNLPNNYGLADLLAEPERPTLGGVLQPTSVVNLCVVTSGTQCSNPWELLSERNISAVGQRLREYADLVLYDTPAALAFTDAVNLTPAVEGAVLCLRALEPPSGADERIVELLHENNTPVLGCVLTDIPAAALDSYQHYHRYYPLSSTALPAASEAAPERDLPSVPGTSSLALSVRLTGSVGEQGVGPRAGRNGAHSAPADGKPVATRSDYE